MAAAQKLAHCRVTVRGGSAAQHRFRGRGRRVRGQKSWAVGKQEEKAADWHTDKPGSGLGLGAGLT